LLILKIGKGPKKNLNNQINLSLEKIPRKVLSWLDFFTSNLIKRVDNPNYKEKLTKLNSKGRLSESQAPEYNTSISQIHI
jgi:hypothetical protein